MTIASVTPHADALATRIRDYIVANPTVWRRDVVAEMIAEGFAATGAIPAESAMDIVRLLGAEHIRADKAEAELVAVRAEHMGTLAGVSVMRAEHARELADMAVEIEAAKQRAL